MIEGSVVQTRKYKGYTIDTYQRGSHKSYDVRDSDGHYHCMSEPSLRVARAEVDAMIEMGMRP